MGKFIVTVSEGNACSDGRGGIFPWNWPLLSAPVLQ